MRVNKIEYDRKRYQMFITISGAHRGRGGSNPPPQNVFLHKIILTKFTNDLVRHFQSI